MAIESSAPSSPSARPLPPNSGTGCQSFFEERCSSAATPLPGTPPAACLGECPLAIGVPRGLEGQKRFTAAAQQLLPPGSVQARTEAGETSRAKVLSRLGNSSQDGAVSAVSGAPVIGGPGGEDGVRPVKPEGAFRGHGLVLQQRCVQGELGKETEIMRIQGLHQEVAGSGLPDRPAEVSDARETSRGDGGLGCVTVGLYPGCPGGAAARGTETVDDGERHVRKDSLEQEPTETPAVRVLGQEKLEVSRLPDSETEAAEDAALNDISLEYSYNVGVTAVLPNFDEDRKASQRHFTRTLFFLCTSSSSLNWH